MIDKMIGSINSFWFNLPVSLMWFFLAWVHLVFKPESEPKILWNIKGVTFIVVGLIYLLSWAYLLGIHKR